MGYTQVALEDKILDVYPDIRAKGLVPRLSFNKEKDAWAVMFKKGTQEYTVYLCKTDADACIDNTYCEGFGNEIKEVLKKFN
jgi:hypothetical protein